MTYRKIVAATDGSDTGSAAVELAAYLARLHDSELVLIHVLDPQDELPDWRRYSDAQALGFMAPAAGFAQVRGDMQTGSAIAQELEEYRKAAHSAAHHLLEDAQRRAESRGAKRIKPLLDEGTPAERIVAAAKSEGADAIVMGSRGFGNLKGLFAGSVSSRVAKEADCPCVTLT